MTHQMTGRTTHHTIFHVMPTTEYPEKEDILDEDEEKDFGEF